MKKLIRAFLCALIAAGLLSGCGLSKPGGGRMSVVTTVFPVYDWAKNVFGENADITLLLDNGVDLHSYQPTAEDIIKISSCDVFICIGGESEEWVDDVLKEGENKNRKVLRLIEELGDLAKAEESIPGVSDELPEEDESDEHIWLSLKCAGALTEAIQKAAAEADPQNAEIYKNNAEEYIKKIKVLDDEYNSALSGVADKTLLFGDRFPFRYLADDYGFKYYAAFSGCSAESEASFETIAFLADKLSSLEKPAVFTTESPKSNIAETVISASKLKDVKIYELDSMQSVTSEDVKNGATYLSLMKKNLNALESGLK